MEESAQSQPEQPVAEAVTSVAESDKKASETEDKQTEASTKAAEAANEEESGWAEKFDLDDSALQWL